MIVERRLVNTAVLLLCSLLAVPAHAAAAPRSVFIEDRSQAELEAAVASGKTTLIYSRGSSMAVDNHVEVARYVARRVAEELGDALVLPVAPDRPPPRRRSAGAVDAYDIVSRALHANRFMNVVIIADEGAGPGDRSVEDLAERLSTDWRPAGVRVRSVTAHEVRPGQGMTLNADYLRRWASRTVPVERRKAIEDQAELLFVDPERKWLRRDMVAVADRGVVVPALGKMLLEQRVSSVLSQIRSEARGEAPVPAPASAQNRLSAIPEDKMSEPLRRAVAEYAQVRPDGLGELGGAGAGGGVGAGGPNLWTVYVHLPEILGPLRQLHEQSHVNPRVSQKLVHFIIMIVARHWTNDIWTAHEEDSIREGLGRDTVKALEEGRHPEHMAEDEAAVYDFCTELLQNKRVSDATYARVVKVLGEEAVVQTAVTAGLYTYLSMAVNMAYPESAPSGRLPPFPR
jgi:4-carboxymuconolactone decarboxylase